MSARGWLLLVGGLTALAVSLASDLYVIYRAESFPVSFRGMLALQITFWYFWIAAGPLAWRFAVRWPVRAGHKKQNAGRHVLLAIALSATILICYAVLYHAMLRLPVTRDWFTPVDKARPWQVNVLFFFSAYFHIEMLVYAAVVAVAHAVQSNRELRLREREALQLSEQLASAKLQVLTAQLQPHFLFNTLHTIGSLILQHKNERASEMLAELGELLRMTLDRQGAALITLRDEFEHLKRYLLIEETRFGDRLTVTWSIDPGVLDVLVPPLILQPLVENALKHGVSARLGQATVNIRASRIDGRLRVSVYNDGPPLGSVRDDPSAGLGLRNVRERLMTLDPEARLLLENVGTTGVRATLDMSAMVAAERSNGTSASSQRVVSA